MREFDSERLTFRLPALRDFEDLAAMRADPVVARFTSRHPATHADSWGRLIRYRGYWDVLGFGYWCVRERKTGRFVGTIGFGDARRGITPSLDGFPEAGWVLASWCHGMGYGREGVAAAHAWLDSRTLHRRSRCIIDPDNHASMRLAACNGYKALGRTTYLATVIEVFERAHPLDPVTTSPDRVTGP